MRGGELEARVQELLEQLGLADAGDRIARGYSGGMQRRLDIAMALVHRPRVLFMDEPTTGLDPEVRVAMWHEIERLSMDEGLTILLTTHYLEEADLLASNLAIVDRGKVVVEGTPEELKARAAGRRDSGRARARGARTGADASARSTACARWRSTGGGCARARERRARGAGRPQRARRRRTSTSCP